MAGSPWMRRGRLKAGRRPSAHYERRGPPRNRPIPNTGMREKRRAIPREPPPVGEARPGLPQHHPGALQGEARHDRGDDQIGPTGSGAEHAGRGQQHGEIAGRVVARADPGRAHVGVACAIGPQQRERGGVGGERRQTDRAHGDGARQRAVRGVPDHGADHPQTEQSHADALRHRGVGAIAQRHADDEQADGVVRGVAEEVDRVGLQRGGASRKARGDLDDEHDGVDRQHRPQHAAIARVAAMRVDRMCDRGCSSCALMNGI